MQKFKSNTFRSSNQSNPLPFPYPDLHVDISTVVDQQLQAESPVSGHGSQVQGSVAAVVGLVDVGPTVDQLVGYALLSRVAGHMESSVSKGIRLINLRNRQDGIKYPVNQGSTIFIFQENGPKILMTHSGTTDFCHHLASTKSWVIAMT